MNQAKRELWERQRRRTRKRMQSIRARDEHENCLIKQGILLVLAQLSMEKGKENETSDIH